MSHIETLPKCSFTNRWLPVTGLLCVALALTGCGTSGDKGTVTGKLTVKGAAPASGTLIKFIGADGKESSSIVNADGTYTVNEVPPGDAKIIVTGSGPVKVVGRTASMPGMPEASKGAAVPKKYSLPGAIPGFAVKKGSNTHDIDLQ
ncbi:hypothetical protein VT84_27355 [Gemmata sp. SH-PL17]|uniref:carboxypeptidase-like regulatory domain-containing protein n=1 Tax=Gemmata sp. SH-PL17 TaxID=1630693 RepID=UPI0004B10783|nr:carboxypeptidase-like regulatory domain-containing protein [Gemmata sp. SH-PL17]AMV28154.1 hypothetical protein VT84_27355 [Gemmata sp. SH-PL17]